ncbi:alkaline phosphatase family protein [Pyrococcus yayanosii]|uniref:Type I phosphodiesterase / nucleotide pyrophosphatase superfamily n=1 Tax=Pyrococcus yayanosii (strain CH1 / JCM 16557) TaxID=529709 RepID=F8AHN9_PYRYC|nr:alkaline phosphatase family protein [Pyrococcus yayanosii]AEH25414.1 Type I phosphodiesterase / nucleotide pyrophosphatase superfamily [Pyrococcus yayanosii CH1]
MEEVRVNPEDVKKVFVIGLDSAPPELLFSRFLEDLPNIRWLVEHSIYGPMQSTIPAITIPAWMVMATGKTPGELGLYGFRHRKKGTYNEIWIAHSLMVKEKAVWDYIAERGKKSVLVGVPPSYPPKKINGWLVSCFITPDASVDYTYPKELKGEIERLVGEYIFDVVFRKEERDEVREQLWEMTEKRFEVIRYLIQEKDWDYFQFVEIGLDRVHHAFWKFFDESHHLYPGDDNPYKNVIPDYYKLLDKEIGETLKLLDLDETAVFIVSDHGIKAMKGAFAINQWLIEEGLLKIKNPEILKEGRQVRFNELKVDWSKTIAWAWGGYYSRVFINVKGREPQGIVPPEKFQEVRDEVAELIKSIRGPNGEKWDTRVFYPEEIYPVAKGDKPDMMVYLDDLNWRAAGTLGYETPYLKENDTGPDDAVHAEYGVFSLYLPGMEGARRVQLTIYDFAPTVLKLFGMEKAMRGRSIV